MCMVKDCMSDGQTMFGNILDNEMTMLLGDNWQVKTNPLRKHAYLNILKFYQQKNENFQIKILIFFIFLLKT